MRQILVHIFKTLGPELWDALNGEINIFVAGAGTGGTFMGTASYLKEKCRYKNGYCGTRRIYFKWW